MKTVPEVDLEDGGQCLEIWRVYFTLEYNALRETIRGGNLSDSQLSVAARRMHNLAEILFGT